MCYRAGCFNQERRGGKSGLAQKWCVTGRTIPTLATRAKIRASPPLTHPTHSRFPIPVPLLGGVRGGFRFPIPDSRPKFKKPTPYSLLPAPLQLMVNFTDADEDLPPASPEEQYQDLLRAVRRRRGFGLLFVRCSPLEAEKLVRQVKQDLPQKTIEVLRFEKPIDNLYGIVQDLPDREHINVLFIQGLEYSFYKYEEAKRQQGWDHKAIYSYSWKGVPHILNDLNQQRERFRDNFKICFVFLLRSFSLNYFIHRAPDFFDWRSGLFDFPSKSEECQQEDFQNQSLNPEERSKQIIAIKERLEAEYQTPEEQADLLVELGMLLLAATEYEDAIANFDQALEIKPDDHQAWYSRGISLWKLGRKKVAIDCYDQALKIKPDYHEAWNNQGVALLDLGRLEAAIACYDQAVKIKPDFHQAWYNKACCYALQGNLDLALDNLKQAITLNPEDSREMAKTDSDFDTIRSDQRFQQLIDINSGILGVGSRK
ncbi:MULTISPECIES: tetratricopeptide repeat protein [Moorena]|nr:MULTISPECIES: tetratricopeptide repeat protein [Moorena]